MKTIVIIAAMKEELEAILHKLDPNGSMTEVQKGVVNFFIVVRMPFRLVLAESGVGKVNAACTTTLACTMFQPSWIFNVGVAGGFGSDQKVLDWVVGEKFIYTDVDITPLGFPPGQLLGEPISYTADPFLVGLIRQMEKEGVLPVPVHYGMIGTGDAFIQRHEQIDYITKTFKGEVLCVEMEGAAIGHICNKFKVPLLSIRSLSDIANSKTEDNCLDYQHFLQKACVQAADLTILLVERLQGLQTQE